MNIGIDVGTTPVVLLAANAARRKILLINPDGTNDVYFSKSGLAVVNQGGVLPHGNGFYSDEMSTNGYIYTGEIAAVSSAGTVHVIGFEE